MKPVMFCRKTSGIPALTAQFDEMRALERGLRKQNAVIGEDPCRIAEDVRESADQGGAVDRFELLEGAGIDDARDHFAHIVGFAEIRRHDAVERGRVAGRCDGRARCDPGGFPAVEHPDRVPDDRQRMFVIFGDMVIDNARDLLAMDDRAPPRSSALISSPVAAFTSGGPARKIVP